jgi:MFS family permease
MSELTTEAREGKSYRKPLALIAASYLVAITGFYLIFPILPPLFRELGLGEFETGVILSLGPLLLILSSPFWGRTSDRRGRKPVFVLGLIGFSLGFLLFTLVAQVGLAGTVGGLALLALFVPARVLMGGAFAAMPVTAQAYIADITTEDQRSGAIALFGIAGLLAVILGPAIGGALATFGLLVPFYVGALVPLLVVVLLWVSLPEPARYADEEPPSLSPFDGRVRIYLLVGVGAFTMLTVLFATLGFYLQDTFALSAQATARDTGIGLAVAALAAFVVQATIFARSPPPVPLLFGGFPVAAVGFLGVLVAPAFNLLLVALAVGGVGLGMVIPAVISALTLAVNEAEQGAVAGLTSSSQGVGAFVGPLAGTALYGVDPAYPFVFCALVAVVVVGVLAVNRPRPTSIGTRP